MELELACGKLHIINVKEVDSQYLVLQLALVGLGVKRGVGRVHSLVLAGIK